MMLFENISRAWAVAFTMLVASAACSATPAPGEDSGTSDAGKPCPVAGGSMVRLASGCIDQTEVTRAEFAARLQQVAASNAALAAPECSAPVGTPDGTCAAAATATCGANCGSFPQTCVTWCQAAAFCAAVGKTLCGGPGGRVVTLGSTTPLADLVWIQSCALGTDSQGNARRRYPYGDTFEDGRCNVATVKLESVKSRARCTVPEAEVYDLAGNAAEWIGGRSDTTPVGFVFAVAGATAQVGLGDQCKDLGTAPIEFADKNTGFRCCAE